MVQPLGLYEQVRRLAVHLIMALAFSLAVATALWATDREPPSYVLAYWIMTRDVYAGGQMDVQFILYRYKAYNKRLDQSVFDADGLRYPILPMLTLAPPLGLDRFVVTVAVPANMPPGPARYQPTFIWADPVNAVHWFWPIELTLEPYEFVVLPSKDMTP